MVSSAFYRGSSLEAKCQSHKNHHMEITDELRDKIINRSSVESVALLQFFENVIQLQFGTLLYLQNTKPPLLFCTFRQYLSLMDFHLFFAIKFCQLFVILSPPEWIAPSFRAGTFGTTSLWLQRSFDQCAHTTLRLCPLLWIPPVLGEIHTFSDTLGSL